MSDQALFETDRCTICRMGFDEKGRPIYPELIRVGRFWCCPNCGASYGENPHPKCPSLRPSATRVEG